MRLATESLPTVLFLLASAMSIAASCTENSLLPGLSDEGGDSIAGMQEVSLSVGQLSTRTAVDSDQGGSEAGQTVSFRWTGGDRISLWATGGTSFQNAVFTHTDHPDDPSGTLFKGIIPAMTPGEYTYCAFYPAEMVTVSGEAAHLSIPSVQTGKYGNSPADIMAASASGPHLSADLLNRIDFRFRHLTHALKITVPAGSNRFGQDITRIVIEFPQPVAGELTYDISDGSVNGEGIVNNTITVDFDEPLHEGEPFWVFTAPAASVDGPVKFTAYGGDRLSYMSEPSVTTAFSKLSAGTVTPVNLGIKEGFSITAFEYELNPEHLGEDVQTLHLTLSEGHSFHDGSVSADVSPDEGGRFTVRFRTSQLQEWGTVTLSPVYESEHALVPEPAGHHDPLMTIAEGGYTPGAPNSRTVYAPYLFFEDFGDFASMSSDDAHSGGFNTGAKSGKTFTYMDGEATGWSGARAGAQEGTGIRLAARREAIFISASYPARIDSAPISNLKPGVSANLRLTFDYGANYSGTRVSNTISIGHVEDPAVFASNASDGTFDASNSFEIDDDDGEYDNLPYKDRSFRLAGCSRDSRITWIGTATNLNGANNTTCWLYIDNVRVSIAD